MLWLKAFHIIAAVAWFAGLFYMFRLFVYQVDHRDQPEVVAAFRFAADRLFRVILVPASVAVAVFALAMVVMNPAYLQMPWLVAKLCLVAGLYGYQLYVGRVRRRFAAGDLYLTSRQCRVRNEIPTLFLIAIVLLAVLRPAF